MHGVSNLQSTSNLHPSGTVEPSQIQNGGYTIYDYLQKYDNIIILTLFMIVVGGFNIYYLFPILDLLVYCAQIAHSAWNAMDSPHAPRRRCSPKAGSICVD